MTMSDRGKEVAQALIGRYGIRATSVANYHALSARNSGDVPKMEAWRIVAGATLDILRSEPEERTS
jgi:hypothetical protein